MTNYNVLYGFSFSDLTLLLGRAPGRNKVCGRPPQYAHAPVTLIFDLFDLESGVRVTCDVATSVPILVFLGLSVLDLGPIYATDRQTNVRRASSL